MSAIANMPDDFFPEISTKPTEDVTFIRIVYYRDRALRCVDGHDRNVEVSLGYVLQPNQPADPERDFALRFSVWQARELVRSRQETELASLGLLIFEFSEEEECQ